jgi:hypothetical protein
MFNSFTELLKEMTIFCVLSGIYHPPQYSKMLCFSIVTSITVCVMNVKRTADNIFCLYDKNNGSYQF